MANTKLIARKPCSFNGKKFFINDVIPTEYILNPNEQAKLGVIAIVKDGEDTPSEAVKETEHVSKMVVNIKAEEGEIPLELTQKGLQDVVDVITSKATEAEKIIKQMTDGDALILVDIADSRKTIKEAAKDRAQEIAGDL